MSLPKLLGTALLSAVVTAAHAQTPVDTASGSPMGDTVHHADKPAVASTTLRISLPDHPSVSLSLADLQAMPQVTLEVLNAHTKANESYSGPLVSDVFAKAGITLNATSQHELLDSYVIASGTDGYFVVFSGAELQPGLNKTQAIVAIAGEGKPLTHTGAFQLVDGADVKPARWVRNLAALAMEPVKAATAQ